MKSQTKNLVVIYQKLFNVAYKKYNHTHGQKQAKIKHIHIRKSVSINSFRQILISYPEFKNIMEQMYESGELLNSLIKWKGKHCNMAIALKYFNIFINMLKVPQNELNWTAKLKIVEMSPKLKENNITSFLENKQEITKRTTEISFIHTPNNNIDVTKKKQIESNSCSQPVVQGFKKYYALDDVSVNYTISGSIDTLNIKNPFQKMIQIYPNGVMQQFLIPFDYINSPLQY